MGLEPLLLGRYDTMPRRYETSNLSFGGNNLITDQNQKNEKEMGENDTQDSCRMRVKK